MDSRFEKNVFDFTTKAGEYTKSRFRSSFETGGFYGSGSSWAPRESRWGRKFTHPVMIDTGTLKDSIKGEQVAFDKSFLTGRSHFGGRINKRRSIYDIWTTEISTPVKGKRGKSRGKGYAAIHNTDPKDSSFTVNQYSSRKPVQRQFIGINPKIQDFINSHYVPMIFEGFPNASM